MALDLYYFAFVLVELYRLELWRTYLRYQIRDPQIFT